MNVHAIIVGVGVLPGLTSVTTTTTTVVVAHSVADQRGSCLDTSKE